MTSLQLFHDLPPHIEAALTESIRRFGVLVPVVVDQHNNLHTSWRARMTTKSTAARLHRATADAIRQGHLKRACVLHLLDGIDGVLEHHVWPDGAPNWDTISMMPLSSGEQVLADAAWELAGHRPDHQAVLVRAQAWLDDSSFRRLVDALCIRRGWPLTEVAA